MGRIEIGEVLSRMRKAKGLTQAELAKRMGISQGRISQVETKGPARVDLMTDWATACGVSLFVSWREKNSVRRAISPRVRKLLYR